MFNAAVWGVPPVAVMEAGAPPLPLTTVTVAMVSAINGGSLARMMVVPGPTGVISTITEVNALPSGKKFTDGTTAATFGLSERSCAVSPVTQGAEAESTSTSL